MMSDYCWLDPVEVHRDRHHGKCHGYDDGKPVSDSFQKPQITGVVDAQRPEGTLEAMHQVKGQRDTADQVNNHDPGVRESILHQPEKIAHLDTVIGLLVFRHTGEPGLDPEV